jgi:YggT family protein
VFVIRNLLLAVAAVMNMALSLYMFIIVARALISWVSPDPYNPIVQFLYTVTEPVLRPVRRRLPMTGIDVSPIIVILAIVFLQRFVVPSLQQAAQLIGS